MKTRKCKNCKDQFTPYNSLMKYCNKSECIRVFVDEAKEKEWKKKKAKIKKELLTTKDYVKLAQQVFNKYINARDKGLPCVSCGKTINGRVNASHFWNANNHWAVRFDERNVHSSCITCNQFLSGNLLEYRTRLIQKIGQAEYDSLESEAKKTKKFTVEELKQIIEYYKQKATNLKNNR